MAVVAADFLIPTGELQPAWFEGQDLTSWLTAWIAAATLTVPAEATPEQADAIVSAYGYWRAYRAKCGEMAGTPNSVALAGELSATTSDGRMNKFCEWAEQWKAAYEEAVGSAGGPVAGQATRTPLGGAMPITYVF
jgi:hypothetical protein